MYWHADGPERRAREKQTWNNQSTEEATPESYGSARFIGIWLVLNAMRQRKTKRHSFQTHQSHLNGCLCFVSQNHSGKEKKQKKKKMPFFSFNLSSSSTSSSFVLFFFLLLLCHFWSHHFLRVDPTSSRRAPPSRCLLRHHNRYFSVWLYFLHYVPSLSSFLRVSVWDCGDVSFVLYVHWCSLD